MNKALLLDFNDAIQHPGRTERFEISTSLENEADLDLLAPITGHLEGVSTGNSLLLTGEGSARVMLECARCLKPVEVTLQFEIDETFEVKGTPAGYQSGGFAEVCDEEARDLFEGNCLIYEELIRQALWLTMPAKVLCADKCEGLPEGQPADEPTNLAFKDLSKLIEKGDAR